jgi:hypothetical protein
MDWKPILCLLVLLSTSGNCAPITAVSSKFTQNSPPNSNSRQSVLHSLQRDRWIGRDNLWLDCNRWLSPWVHRLHVWDFKSRRPHDLQRHDWQLQRRGESITSNSNYNQFLYVLNEILKQPQNVCGLLDVACDQANINPLNSNWSIPIPPNKPTHVHSYPPKSSRSSDFKVLHISDIHIDMDYSVGSEVNCAEPQCCRMPKPGRDSNKAVNPAGYW